MPPSPFGELLRRLRKRAKLSQRDLGTLVGLEVTTISKIENGHLDSPSAETIQRMAVEVAATADETRDLLRLARKAPREVVQWVKEEPQVTDLYRTVQQHVAPEAREAFLADLVADARRRLGLEPEEGDR